MKKRAFTLIELLITSAIFTIVMVSLYSSFQTGIFSHKNIEEAIDTFQSARRAMEKINLELRNAFPYKEDETRFNGDKGGLSFFTLADTFKQGKVQQDYSLVSYEVEGKKLTRLCRRNADALKDRYEAAPEEMIANVKNMEFSYGSLENAGDNQVQWRDEWVDPKAMPVAVKVKLILEEKNAEQEFERTIYLAPNK